MAGQPIMRALETRISEMPGGEEWVFEQLADGLTVGQVATLLGVSRRTLYMWRDREPHAAKRNQMWAEAIRISAEVDADLIGEEFDRLDRVIAVDEEGNALRRIPHAAEVTLATGRAKYRQWRAAVKDPARFGKQDATVNVNVNLGEAHMAALQRGRAQLGGLRPRQLPATVADDSDAEDSGEADFEVVDS